VGASLGHGYNAVPLDVAIAAGASGDPNARGPVAVGRRADAHSLELLGPAYVATPEVLALYGIEPGSIADATDLLTGRDETALTLEDTTKRPDLSGPGASVQHVDLPPQTSAPNSLITPAAMARNGWVPARAAWIVEAAKPFTAAQIDAARAAAADAGMAIEVRTSAGGASAMQTGATVVGALLALAIVAMAVGLIRGESARDIRTLTATGASARTRRALTASTAGTLATLGVLLGMSGAYVALLATYHGDLSLLLPVPVTNLLALAIGLPVAAAGAGWLLAGREPRAFAARQALD
jgi:putative ABC transport system permease protein